MFERIIVAGRINDFLKTPQSLVCPNVAGVGGGYQDSARLLGESWRKKISGHSGKRIAQKSRKIGRSCGFTRTADTERNFAQSQNQIQTLKECLFCHIYCAQLCTRVFFFPPNGPSFWIVTASCAVSNLESQYPRLGYFWNERRFSVESSLQRVSLIFFLWKRKDSSVVL